MLSSACVLLVVVLFCLSFTLHTFKPGDDWRTFGTPPVTGGEVSWNIYIGAICWSYA
jgi:hypothetical protein